MAVLRTTHGDTSTVLVTTDANRDLGIFLLFLGLVGTLPMQYLLDFLGYTGREGFYAAVSGIILVFIGLVFLGFSRKRFTITPQHIKLADGFLRKPLKFTWEGPPSIRLRPQEEEHGDKHVEYWLVNLIDGKRQYVLDRRVGHQLESRSLAEALAKSMNCPVIERGDTGDVVIPREELDLPFRERVRRNPLLLGPKLPKPENCQAREWESEQELGFSWRLAGSAMLSEYLTVALLLLLLAVVPLFPGKPMVDHPEHAREPLQRSFVDLARQDHNFKYFAVCGTCLAVSFILLFGYQKEMRATPTALVARDRLWGVPVWGAKIPTDKLEEIWVRQSTRGTSLQFISDDVIIAGRTSSLETATYLASKIRHYYAKG